MADNWGAENIASTTMGAAGAVANLATNASALFSSVTGFLPHAMLFVPDVKSSTAAAETLDSLTGGAINSDVMALRALVKKKTKKDKSAGGGAAEIIAKQAVQTTTFIGLATELAARGYVAMEVQYNPSSIRISNSAGVIERDIPGGDLAIQQTQELGNGVYTNMNVQLVFDKVNLQDAFRTEGMNLTVGNAVETVGNAVNNLAGGGGGYSVQKPVEGLMSLLNFKRTRQIIFYWSDMFFHGELTGVNANYTMFNKLGHPIRATVDLRLEQTDEYARYKSDNEAWNSSFDALFGEAGVGQLVSF